MAARCLIALVVGLTMVPSLRADEVSLPGDPPQFFVVTAIQEAGLVIQRRPLSSKLVDVPLIVYKPVFHGLKAMQADGRALTAEELKKKLKVGALVLVSPDEGPVEAAYLAVFKKETIILQDVLPRKGATGIQAGE